jgi:iron complex outermembrane receptor protein
VQRDNKKADEYMNRAGKLVLPLVVASAIQSAYGQQAPNDGARVLEETIVTARMRTESLQDVPIAITAFDAGAIEHQDIRNLEDIASNTVGMTYLGASTSGYQSAPTIRGLSSGFLQDRIQNVAVFLDGVYLQRQSMMNMGLMDMQRVEVVKGPQNSLYGHSAFAGAINYVTAKPSNELDAYLGTVQGTDEREDYTAAVSGPIIKDVLLGRAAVGLSEYDGASKNYHPFDDANPSGYNNRGNLGGWDDTTYNLGLTWLAGDSVEIAGSWYRADLQRENQPHYVIGGLRDVAATQLSRYDDMNFNPQSMRVQSGQVITGNTMWQGELPLSPGKGECINGIGSFYPCPESDQRSDKAVVDPRAYGFVADTEVWTFSVDWDIGDAFHLSYLFGEVEHDSSTAGPAERDPLNGATLLDFNPAAAGGPTVRDINSNASSARPLTELEQQSHELRLDWSGNETLSASAGLYYAKVEDTQYDLTIFAPVCGDRDRNDNGSNQDEIAACNVSYVDGVANTPLNDATANPFAIFAAEYWHGQPGNLTDFEDENTALFGSLDWAFADAWNLRLEGRYTWEERSIHRITDGFALPAGEQGCVESPLVTGPFCFTSTIKSERDDKEFSHFAPRATLEWTPGDNSLMYATVAKGIKSGGFNNAAAESQQTYNEEENITFELGTKNLLADGRLRLNASLYYIDWTDMQGSQPPETSDGNILNGAAVVGNIGDVESYGLEVEGSWQFAQSWSVDFGAAFNNAEFDSGTQYDAAQRYYYYQCDEEVILNGDYCGNTEVGGGKVPRNSEQQFLLALNYGHGFDGGWNLDARLDANYQSKQYLTPMNEAYIPSRTVANANVLLSSAEHWEFNFWVKNLFEEDYVGGVLLVAEQSKLLVSQGAERSMGLGLKYRF